MTHRFARIVRNATISLSLSMVNSHLFAQTTTDADAAAQAVRAALANITAGMNSYNSATTPAAALPGPKKQGTKRIGIMLPASDMSSDAGASGAEAVRELESQFLTGPMLEIVRLTARLPVQAYAEAKALDCDYVLVSAVSQKKSSGGLGALRTLTAAAPLASMIPGVGIVASMATMAATQSMAMASSAASSNVKAKAEVTFEYGLHSVDGTTVVSDSQKVKAKKDGEDVLTPLVQQAAGKIVEAASK